MWLVNFVMVTAFIGLIRARRWALTLGIVAGILGTPDSALLLLNDALGPVAVCIRSINSFPLLLLPQKMNGLANINVLFLFYLTVMAGY